MAMPRKIPVEFGVAFPHGAYMVGEIKPVRDYDRSTKDQLVQASDPDTGTLLWAVDVVDGDPEVTKSNRMMTVKVQAPVQPVLDTKSDASPFTPVEFSDMTATAYVDDNGSFSRLAWSLRAKGVSNPSTRPATRTNDKAAA